MKLIIKLALLALLATDVAAQNETVRAIIASIETPRDTAVMFTERRMNPLLAAAITLSGEVEFSSDGTLSKRIVSPVAELVSIAPDAIVMERGGKIRRLTMRKSGNLWLFYTGLRAILAGDPEGVTDIYAVEVQTTGEIWQLEMRPHTNEFADFVTSITVRGSRNRIDFIRTVQGIDNWQELSFQHNDADEPEAVQ